MKLKGVLRCALKEENDALDIFSLSFLYIKDIIMGSFLSYDLLSFLSQSLTCISLFKNSLDLQCSSY